MRRLLAAIAFSAVWLFAADVRAQGSDGVFVFVHGTVEDDALTAKTFNDLFRGTVGRWPDGGRVTLVLPPADSVRPAVVLEGYLSKRGKSLRLWQRRFYIVRYSSIFYYKNEKQASYSLADEPRGIIDLSAVSVIQVCAHDACKCAHQLCMFLVLAQLSIFLYLPVCLVSLALEVFFFSSFSTQHVGADAKARTHVRRS